MMKAIWPTLLCAAAFALLLSPPLPALAASAGTNAATPSLPDDISLDVEAVPGGLEALTCLALNDYWEARGESLQGRVAVAQVVLNRVADSRYPGSVCEVVHQHLVPDLPRACQFSWTCDGLSDQPANPVAWRRSLLLAAAVLDPDSAIDDPTGGALWYHAASVRPAWIGQLVEATVIGAHTFYRDPPVPPLPLPRPDVLLAAAAPEVPDAAPLVPDMDAATADAVAPQAALPPVAEDMVEGVVVASGLRRWSDALNGGLQLAAAVQ